MILFDVERVHSFAEVVCYYSQKNHQFAQSNSLSIYAFSKLSTIRRAWSCAFAILSGYPYMKMLPQHITIERSSFCQVIVEMLSSMMEAIAHKAIFKEPEDKELSLLSTNLFTLMSTIPDDQFAYFISPQCIDSLYKFNLGMILQSLAAINDGEI